MAIIPVRFNTQQVAIPMLSQQEGRTIVASNGDLTFAAGLSPENNKELPSDRGLPMMYYAHNIMPTTYGFQSISYIDEIPAAISGGGWEDMFMVHGATVTGEDVDATNQRTYVAAVQEAGSDTLYYVSPLGVWTPIVNTPTLPSFTKISVAFVNGYSYIWIPEEGMHVFNIDTGLLTSRTMAGLDTSSIVGIVASNGYLIAYSSYSVAWSSAVDVEDFTPSDITGAGGGSVQEAQGSILYARNTPQGPVLYTDTNAVSMLFTGNELFPFEFSAIPGSGGLLSHRMASSETLGGSLYAYTTGGIQKIAINGAVSVLASVSDFIGGRLFEDYDEDTDTLSVELLDEDMDRAIEIVGNRYIVISYGKRSLTLDYTHAIVIDAVNGRMGKLKKTHRKVIEFRNISLGSFLDNKGSMGFMEGDGTISRVDFTTSLPSANGVLIFGKLQGVHDRMLYLSEIQVENVGANFTLQAWPSFDGKTMVSPVTGFEFPEDAGKLIRRYYFDNVARSYSLVLKGAFEVVTLLIHFGLHGRY